MDLKEKAAYIKGLADGLELDTDRKEARVIREMLDLLAEMAGDVDDIGADLTELYEVVARILVFVGETDRYYGAVKRQRN